MARFLIVYASPHGHTARVAHAIAPVLEREGHAVTLQDVTRLPRGVSLAGCDRAIVACPVYFGRPPRAMRRFVATHAAALNARPSYFVSVCGAAAPSAVPEEARAEAERYARVLPEATGWRPRATEIVAGEVAYTRYDPVTRWVMRRISRRTGRPDDTSHDWVFTDWAALEAFAARIAHEAARPAAVT